MNTHELSTKIFDGIWHVANSRKEKIAYVEALLNKERPEKQDFFSRLTVVEEENAKLKAELKEVNKLYYGVEKKGD